MRHRQKPIMKKRTFVAIAMLASSVAFAQQKKDKAPPPPPPPPPVMNVEGVKPPAPPSPPPAKAKEEYNAFLEKNPTVKAVTWNDGSVHVYLKSGKKEVYNMKNEEDVQKLKEKYGELPAPPPPPPPPMPAKVKTVS